jgi:probable F420-dependent oxidoreductase
LRLFQCHETLAARNFAPARIAAHHLRRSSVCAWKTNREIRIIVYGGGHSKMRRDQGYGRKKCEALMKFGIHLPQAGSAASPQSIEQAARQGEDLGFDHIWVSDHVVVPKGAEYPPSAYIYDPLITMTWAAAATKKVEIGTTVLVLSMRPPVLLANQLAAIDLMSGGRLIIGGASGWLEAEFDTLSVKFEDRGALCNEAIDIMRTCWEEDPITKDWPVTGVSMKNIRVKPQPGRHIPIWVGGHSEPAYRRAIVLADGWHGAFRTPEDTKVITERLRKDRPEKSFELSMRTRWDALLDDHDEIMRELEAYQEAGIQHIVAEPRQRVLDEWLRCGEAFAKIFERFRG